MSRRLLSTLLALLLAATGLTWLVSAGPAAAAVTVTGSVVDAQTDEGIAGAEVYAEGYTSGGQVGVTDESGAYSGSIEPGTWLLSAQAPGYLDTYLEVEVTEETNVLPTLVLEPAVAVSGVVVDAQTEEGIADAEVHVESYSDYEFVGVTDQTGAYAGFVPAGTWLLSASVPGYLSATVEIEVTEETTTLPTLALEPSVPVTVTGTVVDADSGLPIADASVEAYGPEYDDATTGADGSFSLDLVSGGYELEIRADEYVAYVDELVVSPDTTSLGIIELTPLVLVDVTGSVIDAQTGLGVADAAVDAYGSYEDYATTDEDGEYTLSLAAGEYDLYVSREGYDSALITVEVTDETTTLPTVELQPLLPGIYVDVHNATLNAAADGATVSLTPAAGGAPTTQVTDEAGETVFWGVSAGDYVLRVEEGNDYVASEPVEVAYGGGYASVQLETSIDLACDPASPGAGLTNMGFESGLSGWTVGYQTESTQVVGADAFTAPWEGSKMARLGESQASSEDDQEPGPNVLCQDFVVDQAEETFAFNLFTYDYTGFDEFDFDVVVTSPSTGETLAAYRQGAWGEGTDLKTSGWRGVRLDLADHLGETVRLTFRSGGTSDSLYAFWAYLDSAQTLPPVIQTPASAVQSTTGSVTTDPVTGQFTVAMPSGSPSDLTLTVPAECADGSSTPTSVKLILNGEAFATTPTTGGKYTGTIPEDEIVNGQLLVEIACAGATTLVVPIGSIVLYDPSGIVTSKTTGQPVVGATVKLYKVPGWTPQDETGPHPADSCQTNLSKADGAPWSQPAPTGEGELVSAASPEISPNVNPFITNAVGYYGWDVAEGCWYVTVEAAGFEPLTSPVVGVPTEVTDLDLQLTPLAIKNTAAPSVSGAVKAGATVAAKVGTWTPGGLAFGYQWLRNGAPIAGATAASYKVAAADVAKALSVRVTATRSGYPAASATSTAVAVPKVGATVTVSAPKKVKKGKKAKVTVTVAAAGGVTAGGKVTVKVGKKVVGTPALSSGKATVKTKKLKKKGKVTVTASYGGSATVAPASASTTIKVVKKKKK